MNGPFRGQSNSGFRVFALSCGGGDQNTSAFGVLLEKNGAVVDFIKLGQIHSRNRDIKKNETDKLFEFIKKASPKDDLDVIAISGWSIENNNLFKSLQEQFAKSQTQVIWVHDETARIFRNSKLSLTEFPSYPALLKYCVALGRYVQEPLIEYAGLFDSDKSILQLNYTPEQHLVCYKLLQVLNIKLC